MEPRKCRQCGYEIVASQNPYDKAAQDIRFCSHGCLDVYEAIKEADLNSERLKMARGL